MLFVSGILVVYLVREPETGLLVAILESGALSFDVLDLSFFKTLACWGSKKAKSKLGTVSVQKCFVMLCCAENSVSITSRRYWNRDEETCLHTFCSWLDTIET